VFPRVIVAVAIILSAVSGYAWLTADRKPDPSELTTVEGGVTRVEYAYGGKYRSLFGVKLWIDSDPNFYFYGSFMPEFKRVQALVAIGSHIRLRSPRSRHDIRSLEIDGIRLADERTVATAHHSNGNWALVMMVVFSASAIYLQRAFRSLRTTTRF